MNESSRKRPLDGSARKSALRLMPSVQECVDALAAEESAGALSREHLVGVVRGAQSSLRERMAEGALPAPPSREAMREAVLQMARARLREDRPAWRPVINATGVVIHTNLGRAPLAEAAIEAAAQAARSPINLEYDLAAGHRGDRDSLVEKELRVLCGAQAATAVNNNAAALLLALNSIAEGREVIVSRGELIEIGGSFRLPEIMLKSGVRLREVGTTNRTHPADYAGAIGPDTALLLKVHPSNYRVVGFTAEVGLAELCELGRRHGVPVMEDLGAGALIDLRPLGLVHEPVVRDRIAAGADLVCFSGDKLLGGPQAGLLVGRGDLIERIKANPLKRALRCGKLTLAALSATLRLYLHAADLRQSLPTLRLLTRSVAELLAMAERAQAVLADRLGADFAVAIARATSEVGSGAMPGNELPTVVLQITHREYSAERVAAFFRGAEPPVIGRIKDDVFQLDLRTIEDPACLAITLPQA